METAAKATRLGRDSLGERGGDSISSSQRPTPTINKVTASTPTNHGYLTKASTVNGILQSVTPARNREAKSTLRSASGWRRRCAANSSTNRSEFAPEPAL